MFIRATSIRLPTGMGTSEMTRYFRITSLFAVFACFGLIPDNASADWKTFWQEIHIGFHRNNDWPDPFNQADAQAVRKPFEIMKSNGWQLHNTIGHDLFRPEDGTLLTAGQRRLQWIANRAPASRRQVFIVRAATEEKTQARVNSVREAIAALSDHNNAPEIFVTDISPPTVSGIWATKINNAWFDNLATPKLPDQTTTGQPGVGSAGSGQ